MSGLASALRVRRRQLDGLARAIAAERRHSDQLAASSATLSDQRKAERLHASPDPRAADAWFAASSRSLAALSLAACDSEDRLFTLRQAASDARARLSLLEQAHEAALASARRLRDNRDQAALDDRSAAIWTRRR